MKTVKDKSQRAVPGQLDTDTGIDGQDRGATRAGAVPHRAAEKLPHERDESARSTGNRLDEQVPPSQERIADAGDDVAAGRVDTDRRGTPNDVPSRRSRPEE